MTYHGVTAVNQFLSDCTLIHQVCCQNEQRNCQKRKAVQTVKHLGKYYGVRNLCQRGDTGKGYNTQCEGDRHSNRHKNDEHNY